MLDERDIQILNILQHDANISYAELGKRVYLSASSVHNRVRRLTEIGVLKRHVVELDREKAGFRLLGFVHVVLKSHADADVRDFQAQVQAIPEVLECHYVTGDYDTILKIVARDQQHLQHILLNQLTTIGNIERMKTNLSLTVVKSTNVLPLQPDDGADHR